MVVYNIQNYWDSGLIDRSELFILENTTFRKVDPRTETGSISETLFSNYFEFRTMDKVQEGNDSEKATRSWDIPSLAAAAPERSLALWTNTSSSSSSSS
jgi:hypothetical protein